MNQVQIDCNVVEQPELRRTGKGVAVTSIRAAHNRTGKNGAELGTVFFNIDAWGALAHAVTQLGKGDYIKVIGRLDEDSWTTQEGQQRRKLKLVADFILSDRFELKVNPSQGGRDYEPGRERREQPQPQPKAFERPAQVAAPAIQTDDEIPF